MTRVLEMSSAAASRGLSTVLLVTTDPEGVGALGNELGASGREVWLAEADRDLMRTVERLRPEAVVVDLDTMPIAGTELVRRIRRLVPAAAVVLVSGPTTVDEAVEAMKSGARDFLLKPFGGDRLVACLDALASGDRPGAESQQARLTTF